MHRHQRIPSGLPLLIAAAIALAAVSFADVPCGTVKLAWDPYPPAIADPPPDLFCLYASTNLGLPLTNWPKIATASGTASNITVAIVPAQYFFFLTASNGWGESPPSNLAGPTPPVLPTVRNLTISTLSAASK